MYPEGPRTLRGAMGEKRDETPFASLLGETGGKIGTH